MFLENMQPVFRGTRRHAPEDGGEQTGTEQAGTEKPARNRGNRLAAGGAGKGKTHMKTAGFIVSLGLVAAAFAGLLFTPAAALAGARQGLEVCSTVIVPNLLPFLVLSGMLDGLGLPRRFGRLMGPLTRRLFALPGSVAVPFVLGLCGGYPMGASAAADLVRRGDLSPRRASGRWPSATTPAPPSFWERWVWASSAPALPGCCSGSVTRWRRQPLARCFRCAAAGRGVSSKHGPKRRTGISPPRRGRSLPEA